MTIATACRSKLGRFKTIWPTPAGGMKLDRIDEMRRAFGDDTLFFIGGALMEQGPDLEKDAQLFAHYCGRDQPYCPVTSSSLPTLHGTNAGIDLESLPSISIVNNVAFRVRRRVLKYTLSNK